MAPRKASTDKPVSNLEADFNETSTATTPYPATNSGYLNNEKTITVTADGQTIKFAKQE